MKSPAFQFYAADYLADECVQMMSLEQEGAYIRLLAYCWREGTIPSDVNAQSVLCKGASTKVLEMVGNRFKAHPDQPGRLTHARLDAERQKQQKWREKSAIGGRKSGQLLSANAKNKEKVEDSGKGASTKPEPKRSNQDPTLRLSPSSVSSHSSPFAPSMKGNPSPNGDGLPRQKRETSTLDFTIWNLAVGKLIAAGTLEEKARTFLAKLAKQYGKPALARAIAEMLAQEAVEPKGYIVAVLQRQGGQRRGASKVDKSMDAVEGVLAELEAKQCESQEIYSKRRRS